MKLLAQHGASNGEKTVRGLEGGYIDGAIYSPRDITADNLRQQLLAMIEINPDAELLFDPQYYAGHNVASPEARLSRLETCEEYQQYFRKRRRRELETGDTVLKKDITDCLRFQSQLGLTGLIGPNILISRSFDSIEAGIAKNVIRLTGPTASKLKLGKPVYATLAISREALLDKNELMNFLADITLLDTPPQGFYVMVASRNTDARSDIFNADVIAGWLFVNYTLSINGYSVINGYSDLLTPFLGVAGAAAGATGWWSNLRTFSLDRFLPAAGGRLPIQRYLSKLLLNRITFFELQQLREMYPAVPAVLNGLKTDNLYPADKGSEPNRSDEVLQTWEAIKSLNVDLVNGDTKNGLGLCRRAIDRANAAYDNVEAFVPGLDPKSNRDHLSAMFEGLRLFAQLAELEGSVFDTK
jgi:hypothetical protein